MSTIDSVQDQNEQVKPTGPRNLLLYPLEVEYLVEDNGKGVWRRFMFPDGKMFAEFKTHATVFGWPILHITWGRNPETMRGVIAKGIIAIGRRSIGVLAIGQMAIGLVAIGQLGLGCFFGMGQATTGMFAIGQLAIGVAFGIGQFTCGVVSIGQMGFGKYVLAQFGIGTHVWDVRGVDPIASQFFRQLFMK